jgi:hypothetical protein
MELGGAKNRCNSSVQAFFTRGVCRMRVNDIEIVLLPKKDEHEYLKDFRLISLCNVVYKVVSKCLVNRMRSLQHYIIASMQSVFIPGRLITDNALIAFECLHGINHGNNNYQNIRALKLDLTKAYDHVEWVYTKDVQNRPGFQIQWVQWIMECVTIICYSVHFNKVSLESFAPTHGLRQGDPLSPYLFLFVADGLSKLLRREVHQGNLRELHICRRASGISHLPFADDMLLFMHISEEQDKVI